MEGRDGKESQNRGGSSQKPTTIVRCYIGVVELVNLHLHGSGLDERIRSNLG